MYKTCAFTGHRNLKNTDFDNALLDRVVADLVKCGTRNFLCGMAWGFDLQAAQSVIALKNKFDIKLTACIPCANQTDNFSLGAKNLYNRVLEGCDEIITLSEYYYPGCMHGRDRYMVDNCDVLVCFLRRNSGGTFYTVGYAEKINKKIIRL